MCRRCVRWCQRNSCITHTAAHALVLRTPVLKCMQHSLQNNALSHIYTYTNMHTHTYPQEYTCASMTPSKHAGEQLQRLTIYAQVCIHINTCTCIYMHTYTYKYTHAYMYIYTCQYTYIHAHIYTHTYNMYICTVDHAFPRSRKEGPLTYGPIGGQK